MPRRSTIKGHGDIKVTGDLHMLAFDAGITIDLFYWNGSIPSEVVLIVKGWPNAFLADSPEEAIAKAAEQFGGL